MTAVNSLQTPTAPGAEPRAYEPSMEEILASIRRIIADDQSLPGRLTPREAEPAPAAEPAPVEEHASHEAAASAPVHVIHAVETEAVLPHVADFEAPRPVAHGPIAAPQFASPEGTHAPEPQAVAPEPEPIEPDLYAEALVAPEPLHLETPEAIVSREPIDTHEPDAHESETWHDSQHVFAEPPRDRDAPAALFSNATDHSVTAAFNTLAATRLADNSDELLGLAREMIRPLLKTWLDDNLPSMVERMVRAEIERVARGGR